jgi:hypothetical protein
MSRTRQEFSPVESNMFSDNRYQDQGFVMTGTVTLTAGAATLLICSAAAPQTIKLPPIARGAHYIISAITSTVTVQDSAGGAVGSVAAGKTSAFYAAPLPATGVLTWFIHAGA